MALTLLISRSNLHNQLNEKLMRMEAFKRLPHFLLAVLSAMLVLGIASASNATQTQSQTQSQTQTKALAVHNDEGWTLRGANS